MGQNLHTACHKCRERIAHYRGKEAETLPNFYVKHIDCILENPDAVDNSLDSNHNQKWWVESEEYTDLTDTSD